MRHTEVVDLEEAIRILGVEADADEPAQRAAHRRAIRRAHPDAGGSAAAAATVNEAWARLRAGESAPAAPRPGEDRPARPARPEDVDAYYLVDAAPADLLARLAEAGHFVGEVVFVDPHVGMLEIVVGEAPAVGQLAVTVGASAEAGTEVSFTLEPLGVTPAPAIGPVVAKLMESLTR